MRRHVQPALPLLPSQLPGPEAQGAPVGPSPRAGTPKLSGAQKAVLNCKVKGTSPWGRRGGVPESASGLGASPGPRHPPSPLARGPALLSWLLSDCQIQTRICHSPRPLLLVSWFPHPKPPPPRHRDAPQLTPRLSAHGPKPAPCFALAQARLSLVPTAHPPWFPRE